MKDEMRARDNTGAGAVKAENAFPIFCLRNERASVATERRSK